jgi:predicted nucleic acid-binding protein
VAAVLVDAGALIALLDRADRNHAACREALASIDASLLTVVPVVTEAMHLLAGTPPAQEAILDMIDDAVLTISDLDKDDWRRIKTLMRKYRDLPMDLADAALVRVAEREKISRILTFDGHFSVYALPGRARFELLARRK